MRLLYTFVILAGLATSLGFAAKTPNVIILLADDMGNGDASCYGAKDTRRPTLTRSPRPAFAYELLCPRADLLAVPGGLLTGRYPTRAECPPARTSPRPWRARPADPRNHIAELAKAKGYATAVFGKWHLGSIPECQRILKASTPSWATMPVVWIASPTCITPANRGITTCTATASRYSRTART